jgi:hypothetical protein
LLLSQQNDCSNTNNEAGIFSLRLAEIHRLRWSISTANKARSFNQLSSACTAPGQSQRDIDAETEQNHLSRLKIFAGAREFPARVKCASLSWHMLCAAIEGRDESGATEYVDLLFCRFAVLMKCW